eukprot:CAMPEP_0197490812 /NCGR_PEP_ID=MMETSP1311-20131121/5254_1 /TAXON_ID=464262 /ORGANISM="Genus nov. species nov., Strain RCC856" /LENGTH=105 /DNA_ID=CAMNT_0043035383 /DNA_START=426 /DNA_END=740 /DNA_ORIENTATION=-
MRSAPPVVLLVAKPERFHLFLALAPVPVVLAQAVLELVVELGAANLFDHFLHHVFVLVIRCVAAFLGAHEGRSSFAKVEPSTPRSLPLSLSPRALPVLRARRTSL